MSITRIISARRRITVAPWEVAVVLRDGAIVRTTGAGRHRRLRRETWYLVDSRSRWLTLAPQEVLTSDGVQVRVTPLVRYAVTDAIAWLTASAEPEAELYTNVQLAVRTAVAAVTIEAVLATRGDLLADAADTVTPAAAVAGMAVEAVRLRDITLPGELRRAIAETALAREEGRAKLERARGESAALRSLANAAQVLEAHPALLELRAIEAAGIGGQLIVRVGDTGSGS